MRTETDLVLKYVKNVTLPFFFCFSHSSDRVGRLEAMVDSYKKKLEDLGDLRRQVRLLEERNTVYMQRTCELEEELRRANAVRAQLEAHKRQVWWKKVLFDQLEALRW